MPAVLLFDYATNITIYLSIRYTNSSGTPQNALLAVSGMLNGIFGSGEERHLASWQSVKARSCSTEEEDNGTIIQREREYFTNELTLVYANGKTAILN